MAAMVGTGRVSSVPSARRRSRRNLSTWAFVIDARSMRSAPAQNEPGVEERTMSTRVLCREEGGFQLEFELV